MRLTRKGFAAGAASAFGSIAIVTRPASAAEYTLKWAHATQLDHPLSVNVVRVAAEVKRRTNGRMEIQNFGNNVLGGDTQMLAQVRAGSIQLYSGFGGIYSIVAPVANIEAVGFAFKTQEQALRAFDGPLGRYVRNDIETKAGLHVFDRAWVNGFRQITTSTKPIRVDGDLSGLKIRTPATPIWVDMFKTLGASPTPINANEMYTALQTHVVDAQENPFVIMLTYRLYEVQKYISVTNHMWSNFWVVANGDYWKSLPPNLQQILAQTIDKYALSDRRETEILNNSLADKLSRMGMQINRPDTEPFKAKLSSGGFYARWRETFGPAAWALLEQSVGKLG